MDLKELLSGNYCHITGFPLKNKVCASMNHQSHEKKLAYARQYWLENKEKINERNKKYRQRNKQNS